MSRDASHRPPAAGVLLARRRLAAGGVLLATLSVPPAAVLAVPDTTANVVRTAAQDLGLGAGQIAGMLRATGLTLPALLLAVPVAGLAARRFTARPVLAAGLLILLGGLATAHLAGSVPLAGALRAVQGLGAGIALPASLVLMWERRSLAMSALWSGALAAALLAAMPLALCAVPPPVQDGPGGGPRVDWHVALAPYLWPAAVAAVAALVCLAARSPEPLAAARHAERGQLMLPFLPVAGLAFLAVVSTYGWSPGARAVVAGIALITLLGLAMAGTRDATTGSPLACAIAMVTVGLLGYPLAGPLAGLAGAAAQARGEGGVPVLPFASGAAAALLGALATVRLTRAAARTAVLAGHGLMLAAVPLGLAIGPGNGPWLLAAFLVPLGAGAGTALAASLRDASVGAALYGLSLCFPAVLAGQLMVLSLQAASLKRALPLTGQRQLDGLAGGYRAWLVAAGVAAVLLTAACARATARRRPAPSGEVPHTGGAVPEPLAG